MVDSPNVHYSPEFIHSKYVFQDARVSRDGSTGAVKVSPVNISYEFKVDRKVPKLGLLMVGWGGNNGSTLTASILANKKKVSWRTKEGEQEPNYFGSVTQSSTLRLGVDAATGQDVYIPFNEILPMVHPNDLVLGGWDISSANLADAMVRAKVLDWDLQRQLLKEMETMKPMPSVYYPDFIAANQADRADNLIPGTMSEQLEHLRKDIR